MYINDYIGYYNLNLLNHELEHKNENTHEQ